MSTENKSIGNNEETYQLKEISEIKNIIFKIFSGLPQSFAFSCLGLFFASCIFLLKADFSNVTTTTRVTFSFKGSSNEIYPDKSKFSYQDVVASDIIQTALNNEQLNTSDDFLNKIKQGISIEGIIPLEKVKARDRLIASGQTIPALVAEEFSLNLTLSRNFPLTLRQRSHLLNSILNAFRFKFERTYAMPPIALGNLSNILQTADYDDFERILSENSIRIEAYLSDLSKTSGTFRSGKTKLSFGDLINENLDFNQIYRNKTLGLINEGNLAKDRKSAIIKMDYQLYELSNLEKHQIEEEKLTRDFLADAANHNSNYILGIKSQIIDQRNPNTPVLDKGLVDSLLANDTYSFIIKRALEASLKLKDTQVQEHIISENRKKMIKAIETNSIIDKDLAEKATRSMQDLIKAYENLVRDILDTYSDYAAQEFSDCIHLSAPIVTDSIWKDLLIPALVGLGIGGALGMGLSLLDINLSKSK